MKKTILNRIKKKGYSAMGKLAAAFLLLVMSGACVMEVSATETELQADAETEEQTEADFQGTDTDGEQTSSNQRITYIYHQHTGNSDVEGGCYRGIIYHTHIGNETEGGECYQTPVYHVHTGNTQSGGTCYRTPVYHRHTGNSQTGGGCYTPIYHSHSDNCYSAVPNNEYGCYVVRSWDTSEGDYEGHDFQYYEMSCGITILGTNAYHEHTVLDCNKSGTVVGYTLGCGKSESSVESYAFDCMKTPGLTIDSYALNCGKTLQTIDGYSLSCGKDEETPCGVITITENQGDNKEETKVEIELEDLTGGELQLGDVPYTWEDATGNVIGTGSSITVAENGTYRVTVGISNEDINRDSLNAEIDINSIVKPVKKEDDNYEREDSGSNGGEEEKQGEEEQQGEEQQGEDGEKENSQEIMPSASPTATPANVVAPTALPEKISKENGKNENGGNGDDNHSLGKAISDEAVRILPTPSVFPEKETGEVMLEEKKSENTELQEVVSIEIDTDGAEKSKLRRIFASPVVQVISITAGTLTAVGGLLLLCYLLFMTVKVYNDNGEGRMVYLGRSRILLKEEGYVTEISEQMMEKTVTNRFCLKPGAFRMFKGDEEELLVCCRQKKVSVPLSREMIVVI